MLRALRNFPIFLVLLLLFLCTRMPFEAQAGSLPAQSGIQDLTATTSLTSETSSDLQTATPGADGSIVHEVQPGESFYSIADEYDISLDELFTLNNLSEGSLLQPGDRLIIRQALPPTETPEPSKTPTIPLPTSTRRPTRTPTLIPPATATAAVLPSATPTPARIQISAVSIFEDVLPVLIFVLVVVGVVLVILGGLMRRKA